MNSVRYRLALGSLLGTLLAALVDPAAAADRISLCPAQAIDVSGESVARFLVDEQNLADDPRRGSAGGEQHPETEWTLGWTNWETFYPLEAVIDLGQPHDLEAIGWFDGTGQQELIVSTWNDGGWKELARDPLAEAGKWTVRDLKARSRYVRFLQAKPGGTIREIALYGTPVATPPEAAAKPLPSSAAKRPTEPLPMERFLGTNGFLTSPLDRVAKVAGVMREYHQWQWDEGNQDPDYRGGRAAWNPSWVSGPGWGWNFDDFYTRALKSGIEIQPVTQGTLPYLVDGQSGGTESHPVPKDRDTEDPKSYREHAQYLYQFAARYGTATVDGKLLKLKDDQQPKTGLGLVRWIENWNEPDKTWRTRSARFRPWELAALCSADYDGHRGALGPGHGLKTADSEMRMLSGGLFKLNVDYLRAMRLWADLHRDGVFPADGIAVHHYCRTDESLQKGAAEGPETHNLLQKLKSVVEWRNREAPGLEIWFGEFGYDTNPASPQAARPFPGQSIEQTQGLWMVRTFLIAALAGVDRAQMYMLADVDPASRTQFDTGGLLGAEKQGFTPKPSYYHVATLRNVLTGTRFAERLDSPEGVFVLRFESIASPGHSVFAIWTDEQHAPRQPSVRLKLASPTARRIDLADDRDTGVVSELTVRDGAVEIPASASPVFVVPGQTSGE